MNNSFVFYNTFYETYLALREGDHDAQELARQYLEAVIEYGLTGEFDETNKIVLGMMQQVKFSISKAKDRYEVAKENGSKGGRPTKAKEDEVKELLAQNKTAKEIAAILGCSERTAQRRIRDVKAQENIAAVTEDDTEFVF